MQKLLPFFSIILLFILSPSCNNEPGTGRGQSGIAQVEGIPSFNRDSAYNFIAKQVDFGPRNPGSDAHQACKEWLVAQLKSFGASVQEQDFNATIFSDQEVTGTNIFAQFNPESNRRLLFGAHWDSRPIADSPLSTERRDEPVLGADDGASGVGVLLEIARLIGADTTLDLGIDLVFFDVEDAGESGGDGWALGAQYWSRNLPYDNVRPLYGVLLDMVGSKGARFAKERHSTIYASDQVEKIWSLARYMGYSNFFVNEVGGQITDDHLYVNTIAKIPMVDIINQVKGSGSKTGFGAHWHTHDDNMDIIDKTTIRSVGKLLLELIYREDASSI